MTFNKPTQWLEWVLLTKQPTSKELSDALAKAAQRFAVRLGVNPTRVLIHNSQLSDELAVVANDLGIQVDSTQAVYNKNKLCLSRPDRSEDLCQIKPLAQEILCHKTNQLNMF